jgi:protein involved in polysaccharide export with SLBB domain
MPPSFLRLSFSLLLTLVAYPVSAFNTPVTGSVQNVQGYGASAAGQSLGIAPPGLLRSSPSATSAPSATSNPSGADNARAERAPDTPPAQTRALAEPSKFQRFVQETTGEWLPVFGSELFQGTAFAPDTTLPAPANYLVGPGDEIRINVWGSVDYSGTHLVDRSGRIQLPKVGTIAVAGTPVRQLEALLKTSIARVFTNFEVSASLGRLRSIQIYVVGQAQQPGVHTVPGLSTLVNAVFASGGPTANGSMRRIELKREGRTVSSLDLYDFIALGSKGADLPLQAGDVIVIPPAGPRVAITGAFDQAAIYELKNSGVPLSEVLQLSGGVPTLAATRKALLERIDPSQAPARQVQELSLSPLGLLTPLKDADVVTLLPISPGFGNAITLQGTVAQPLRHPFVSGMRVQDLIPEREALITPDYYRRKNLLVQNALPTSNGVQGVTERVNKLAEEINWDYAVVERLNKDRLTTELLPFNLRKAVVDRDPAHNLLLQAGDVVTVLSNTDVRLPQQQRSRLVRLEGEVAAPGVYQALPGETLPQLIARVGGLTPQAYVFGTELLRESVKTLQQQNLVTLIRQLEGQLQAQTRLPASPEAAAQATLAQQQQQAQVRTQLDRLKTLQSNGRLALELSPEARLPAQALPALPLEDGDRIHIPSLPSFVAAAGAVHNENVFIHKVGKTVGDILQSAGLTEDAEISATFVLRADGTVVSSRGTGGWLGGRNINSLSLMPGDTVVVPAKLDRESRYDFITRSLKDWTQIFSSFGLGVAALKTIQGL